MEGMVRMGLSQAHFQRTNKWVLPHILLETENRFTSLQHNTESL